MSSPEEEFRLLMGRVRAGCPEAARELFDQYGDAIRRVVRRRLHHGLRSQYDSVDFTQDVWASFFTTPYEKYTFDTPEALVAFLSDVAFAKVAQAFRHNYQTKKGDVTLLEPLPSGREEKEGLRGHDPTPSQVAIANEHWERMLEGQPIRLRFILELLRKGHEQKEVAERTGMHPKVIQRLLQKMAQRRDLQ